MAASIVDKRTPKWHDGAAALVAASTPAPDVQAAVLHAKYARVVAVRLGIRFAGDPAGLKEISEALGLAVAS